MFGIVLVRLCLTNELAYEILLMDVDAVILVIKLITKLSTLEVCR